MSLKSRIKLLVWAVGACEQAQSEATCQPAKGIGSSTLPISPPSKDTSATAGSLGILKHVAECKHARNHLYVPFLLALQKDPVADAVVSVIAERWLGTGGRNQRLLWHWTIFTCSQTVTINLKKNKNCYKHRMEKRDTQTKTPHQSNLPKCNDTLSCAGS